MWYSLFNPDLAKPLLFEPVLSTAQIQYGNHDQYNVRLGRLPVLRPGWEAFRTPGLRCLAHVAGLTESPVATADIGVLYLCAK